MTPNEQALLEVVKAARGVINILIAVKMTAGLGRTQIERLAALQTALAKLDECNP